MGTWLPVAVLFLNLGLLIFTLKAQPNLLREYWRALRNWGSLVEWWREARRLHWDRKD